MITCIGKAHFSLQMHLAMFSHQFSNMGILPLFCLMQFLFAPQFQIVTKYLHLLLIFGLQLSCLHFKPINTSDTKHWLHFD